MNATTLHYIYDPLCGWCYAVSPLVRAAREVLPVVGHGGGMLTGARRQPISPEWRDYVTPKDHHISQLTGQVFGRAYKEGLLRDYSAILDSEPPITGVLAAEDLAGRGLDFLEAVQKAHYSEGRRVADLAVLKDIAGELGLKHTAFKAAYERFSGERTRSHFVQSRRLLAAVGGDGFPTFVLERGGAYTPVDYDRYLSDPTGWMRALGDRTGERVAVSGSPGNGCGSDGCIIRPA